MCEKEGNVTIPYYHLLLWVTHIIGIENKFLTNFVFQQVMISHGEATVMYGVCRLLSTDFEALSQQWKTQKDDHECVA